jgi:hypothetical protein
MRKKSLSNLKRRKNFKPIRKNFLIVCEGEKTEPLYFSSFRVPKKVFDVVGLGVWVGGQIFILDNYDSISLNSCLIFESLRVSLGRVSLGSDHVNHLKIKDNIPITGVFHPYIAL